MIKKNPSLVFRQSLKRGPFILPGAFDVLSSLLIEQQGFKGVYLSGGGLSVSYLGKPDMGFLQREDIISQTKRITEVVKTPLIVDIDTGFGGPQEVAKTIRYLEEAGAAGVQLEDQVTQKRCGHLEGKSVIPLSQMVLKVKAAVQAKKNSNFIIVARTDARSVEGLEAALIRAEAYQRAGADVIFPEGLMSKAEFLAFGQKKTLGTLMANMTEFGCSPALSVSDLVSMGYRIILYPMTAFRVAAFSMKEALLKLKQQGHSRDLQKKMQTRSDLYKLINYKAKVLNRHFR
ncbi:MAG: oxaloacetate decarboxylase [Elusimicrobiota bacterium]